MVIAPQVAEMLQLQPEQRLWLSALHDLATGWVNASLRDHAAMHSTLAQLVHVQCTFDLERA